MTDVLSHLKALREVAEKNVDRDWDTVNEILEDFDGDVAAFVRKFDPQQTLALLSALETAYEGLKGVARGHTILAQDIDAGEVGVVKEQILVTPETECARQALADIEKLLGGKDE